MKRFAKYGRQVFLDDVNLKFFGTGILLTIFCWTIGIFFWGIDLLLFPLTLGLFILMLSGPIIIVTYLIKKNQVGQKIKNLGLLKSLVFGAYLGFALLKPIFNWDELQRQKSGLIISKALENFKNAKGNYPTELAEIKDDLSDLPIAYKWDKFNYHATDDSYDLDIPVPIMDRWHWERDKKVFVYDDF
jgi:hypothetical protein